MREYFLDPKAPLPSSLEIFCWPFPSNDRVIARALFLQRPGSPLQLLGDLLKFFPLAFFVVYERAPGVDVSLARLRQDQTELDHEGVITIPFRSIPRVDWPEQPGADELVLFDDLVTIVASPTEGAT